MAGAPVPYIRLSANEGEWWPNKFSPTSGTNNGFTVIEFLSQDQGFSLMIPAPIIMSRSSVLWRVFSSDVYFPVEYFTHTVILPDDVTGEALTQFRNLITTGKGVASARNIQALQTILTVLGIKGGENIVGEIEGHGDIEEDENTGEEENNNQEGSGNVEEENSNQGVIMEEGNTQEGIGNVEEGHDTSGVSNNLRKAEGTSAMDVDDRTGGNLRRNEIIYNRVVRESSRRAGQVRTNDTNEDVVTAENKCVKMELIVKMESGPGKTFRLKCNECGKIFCTVGRLESSYAVGPNTQDGNIATNGDQEICANAPNAQDNLATGLNTQEGNAASASIGQGILPTNAPNAQGNLDPNTQEDNLATSLNAQEDSNAIAPNETEGDITPNYFCASCKYQTSSVVIPINRIRNNDLPPRRGRAATKVTNKFLCEQCPHQASSKGNLKQHREAMHEMKMQRCNQCTFQSVHRLALYRHEQVVHTKKIRKCNQSLWKSYLKQHREAVHKKKILRCNYCDYQSGYKKNFIRHEKKVHGQK